MICGKRPDMKAEGTKRRRKPGHGSGGRREFADEARDAQVLMKERAAQPRDRRGVRRKCRRMRWLDRDAKRYRASRLQLAKRNRAARHPGKSPDRDKIAPDPCRNRTD